MNNSQLQAMIDEFGDRIAIIQFDNQCKIYIGYEGSPVRSVEDLQFKTVGGFDMVGVPHKVMNPRDEGKLNAIHWHCTHLIHQIVVMGEDCADYRLDPMEFVS